MIPAGQLPGGTPAQTTGQIAPRRMDGITTGAASASAPASRRALIVKLGAIGDVIMAVPAVRQLHEQGYTIDWVCGPALQDLLRAYAWINVIVADDKAVLHGSPIDRLRSLLPLWRQLRRQTYDLSATLYYDRRWLLLALPAHARRSLMLSRTDRSRRILPGRHHSDEFARILLGLPDECRDRSLTPLRPGLIPPSPLPHKTLTRIALVPGGASNVLRQQALRRWPVDRYAALAAALLQRGFEVVLLGGPDDTWVRETFAGIPDKLNLYDAIGTLRLTQVIAAADTCDLVVTHDTGPLHLAGLSHAPILALFGPTDPATFLPRRPDIHVLWGGEHFACRPCYDGRNFAPCPDNGCMQSISLPTVLQNIDNILTDSTSPPNPLTILERTTR